MDTIMKKFRKHHGLRQIEAAKLLGLSTPTLRRIDRGLKELPSCTLDRMQKITDAEVRAIKQKMKDERDYGR